MIKVSNIGQFIRKEYDMSTKLTDLASIERIIDEMTLEEKAKVVTGGEPFKTEAQEKYGIPATVWLDGGTGYNAMQYAGQMGYEMAKAAAEAEGKPLDRETFGGMGGLPLGMEVLMQNMAAAQQEGTKLPDYGCFPPGIFFGASCDPEAIEACGYALGEEMNFRGVDVVLGTPNINIHRDPRNGRLFEGYSEDPMVVSELAPAFVRGVQRAGVVANAKHYAANNQETDRMGVNEHISERAMREIYLPGYHACIKEGLGTIMSAYNSVNGLPCAQNPWLLDEVLRKEWGFEGAVVSDWSAAYDQVAALAAGNDLAMPGPRGIQCIINAVEEGKIPEEQLNESVRRVLRVLLDTPAMKGRKTEYDRQAGINAAERIAQEGLILLQNDGTLPLADDVNIAFYGKRSKQFGGSGAGSAQVDTCLMTTPFDSMTKRLGEDRVTWECAGENTNVWIVTVGANGQEGADRPHMDMDDDDKEAVEKAIAEAAKVNGKVILLLNTEGPVTLADYTDRVNAIVCAFYPGMMGGKVFCDLVFDEVNPSGKLPLTWPVNYIDCPTALSFPGEAKESFYGEGIYVGYRYYDKKNVQPLYPFGYGLSYTTFSILDMEAPEKCNVDQGDLTVKVTVKNTGDRDGKEVVQLYVHDVVSRFDKPVKELKAFKKVFLRAGEEKQVTLTITKEKLASFSSELREWVTEPGEYDLMAGTSAEDIACVRRVMVECANPFYFRDITPVGDIAASERAVKLISEISGIDFMKQMGMVIVFMPSMSFHDGWESFVKPVFTTAGRSEQEAQEIYDKILAAFKEM